jgi:hypothetical protein
VSACMLMFLPLKWEKWMSDWNWITAVGKWEEEEQSVSKKEQHGLEWNLEIIILFLFRKWCSKILIN